MLPSTGARSRSRIMLPWAGSASCFVMPTRAYGRVAPHSPCRAARPMCRTRSSPVPRRARQRPASHRLRIPRCSLLSVRLWPRAPSLQHRPCAPASFPSDAGWRLPVLSVSLSNGRPSLSPGQQPDHYPALGTCGSHAEPRNPEISARSARLQGRSQARCAHTARIEPAIPAQNPQASLVTCGRCRGVTARPARNAAGSNLRHHGYGRSPGLPECGNHMFPARGVKRARPAATLGAGDCCRCARPDEGRNS